jgi:hypothetical protein
VRAHNVDNGSVKSRQPTLTRSTARDLSRRERLLRIFNRRATELRLNKQHVHRDDHEQPNADDSVDVEEGDLHA